MEDIFVGRVMSSGIHTVDPDTPIEEAAAVLLEERIGSLVVTDDENQPTGIVTKTDFVRLVAHDDPAETTTVDDQMSGEVVTLDAQDHLQKAADLFITYNIHHLPVVDDTEGVIGMLSTTDLTSYMSGIESPTP
jgi:CBS domain-containing protein